MLVSIARGDRVGAEARQQFCAAFETARRKIRRGGAVAARAARCGVKLAIEPLNRFGCYFLNTAAACDALVRAIEHPAVCGVMDTHHAHIEEGDVAAAITASARTLGHVQLSENHRGTPGRASRRSRPSTKPYAATSSPSTRSDHSALARRS